MVERLKRWAGSVRGWFRRGRPRVERSDIAVTTIRCRCGCGARYVGIETPDGTIVLASRAEVDVVIGALAEAAFESWPGGGGGSFRPRWPIVPSLN